ncbi:n-acetyltransferase b complex non catalytic subunit [Cystoisospora suis]|uniref:N-acetyltransferase b complex non catalytic subunit n=1 Tax=Cystoisospora suis TaxID=483139 RepID=A0A2C6KHH2_9APIC|nr:n-acetyltransferase b complex non catalytic subunit [Cystoisospora suis]
MFVRDVQCRVLVTPASTSRWARCHASSLRLVNGWTPVAPGRLLSAESMHALTAPLPQDFLTLLQRQEEKLQSDSLGKGNKRTEEEENARELLDSLYGKSWRFPPSGGFAVSGRVTPGPVSPSKTAEVLSKLVDGVGKRTRLRCLTLLALLPPVSPYVHGAPLAYSCLESELKLLLGGHSDVANDGSVTADRGSAPAGEDQEDSVSSGPSNVPVCWPSAAVAGPCEYNAGGALPWQSGRLAVQSTTALLLQGIKLLQTGFVLGTGNDTDAGYSECVDRQEELFYERLEAFVQGCRDVMHLAAQSIYGGFAAFLPAHRSKILESAEALKARTQLCGADTNVALTLWDALYVLATLSTTHLAVLTAALQYGGAIKKQLSGHTPKDKSMSARTPFQTKVFETVGRLIHDANGVIAMAAEMDTLVEEVKGNREQAQAHAWWIGTPVCGSEDDEYRLDFIESQEFCRAAATLAADSVFSYGHDVLPVIAQGLERRRVWLEQVTSSIAVLGGLSLPNLMAVQTGA